MIYYKILNDWYSGLNFELKLGNDGSNQILGASVQEQCHLHEWQTY